MLVDVRCWPRWGPTVAAARLDGGGHVLTATAVGQVRPSVGPWVPFTVDRFVDGREWSWRVAGVPATSHRVEPLAAGRCRVAMHVPTWALPYAPVCAVALRRIERLVTA